MVNKPRNRLLGLVLVVVTLTLAGCSDKVSGSAYSSSLHGDINPRARDALQDGGTLHWPIDDLPSTFNMLHDDGGSTDLSAILGGLTPYAFDFDAAGNPTLVREYLDAAEITATRPKQVVTFRINRRAVWDDGKPITAADYISQWRALNGTNTAFKTSETGYDKIENVAAGENDRVVIVTYKQPYANWRLNFNWLLPASTTSSPATFNEGWRSKPLTTGGPFRFDRVDVANKTVVVVRNERWWGNPAKLDRIVFHAIDRDAQPEALRRGELDFIEVANDAARRAAVRSLAGVSIRTSPSSGFRQVTFNATAPLLRDIRVRRAVALAIDRKALARPALIPLGLPVATRDNHIFGANQPGYRRNDNEFRQSRVGTARRLLTRAGWQLVNGRRTKNGRQLALRCVISDTVAYRREAANVRRMLAKVGVGLTIDAVSFDELYDNRLTPGNYDIGIFSWGASSTPITMAAALYSNPRRNPDGSLEIRENYARIGSPAIDHLFAAAESQVHAERARSLADRADKLIWREVHSLPLYERADIVAVRSNLANFGAFGSAGYRFEDIGFVKS